MNFKFYKYQGTGNDFIMIDNREPFFPKHKPSFIAHLCHRRFGIGADGLILLENYEGYDFRMVYFNADGSEGSMCGNGGRCTVKFAHFLGLFATHTRFMAVDGEHEAFLKDAKVHIKMIPVNELEKQVDYYFLNTGSPHYVQFVENLADFAVFEEGRKIRYNQRFAQAGTNVNFVEQVADNQLFVRTYERGVEDETYSCGTGVTACALVSSNMGLKSPVQIKTLGGELQVSFEKSGQHFNNIYLAGPAEAVFAGEYKD
ncbi:MAG: diaminopimelate epimerase [Microscillaceae bacterium]|nr:diaminopimelate epimerase [Microscillaceae bacterium]